MFFCVFFFFPFFPCYFVIIEVSLIKVIKSMGAINKTVYFDSEAEAIITLIVTIVAALISGCMFIHTGYKFYVEDISHALEDDFISSNERRKSRAKLPSLNGNDESHLSHHKEIHEAIAFLTILYLFSGVSYTFTQSIIRIITIFFDYKLSCETNEYLQLMVAIIRSMLYLLFLSRLYLTFLGSHLAYKTYKLIILGIIILLTNIFVIIFWILNTKKQIKQQNGECKINYTLPAIISYTCDTLINIILLYAFMHKLSQLIQIQTAEYIGDPSTLKRIKDLIKLMTKLTVLACVAVISSWITTALFIVILPHIIIQFDIIIGTFCILFSYEFHQKKYMTWCFLFRQCCYHVCFWWFISQDYICKKNDNDDKEKDGFEGGCFQVLFICCKYDNNDTDKILVIQSQELMVGDKDKINNSDNNNDIPTKDGGKSFTDQILKSPTNNDELSDKSNFTFSHRAFTLKKLQNVLADDEGIENTLKELRFTLRGSKRIHTLRSINVKKENVVSSASEIVFCE